MSAPLAGKFQDHYEVLGVEPTVELEAIQLAYTRLAREFHPSTPETGDREKFDAINLAYEVLSQADLRREFDKLKGIGEDKSAPLFTGRPFFETLGRESGLRAALLCVLYDRRRKKPFTPSLSVRHVENIIASNLEEMALALWYLKERRQVVSDDKSSLQITVQGIDFLEENPPSADLVMPFIKSGGLALRERAGHENQDGMSGDILSLEDAISEYDPELAIAPMTPEDESRRANLNRILSRGPN